jgi:hypothetical protein
MKKSFNKNSFITYINEIKQFTELDHKNNINNIINESINYKDLIHLIQEKYGKGTNWAKQLIIIWIDKEYINKNKSNRYEKRY